MTQGLKISQMPKATVLSGEEVIPVIQNSTNKAVSVELLKSGLATMEWVQSTVDNVGGKVVVVPTLPSVGDANKIYLIPNGGSKANDVYDEYIYLTSTGWEFLGNKQVTIDMSNYYNKAEMDVLLLQLSNRVAALESV